MSDHQHIGTNHILSLMFQKYNVYKTKIGYVGAETGGNMTECLQYVVLHCSCLNLEIQSHLEMLCNDVKYWLI